jgi:hypothetical protein
MNKKLVTLRRLDGMTQASTAVMNDGDDDDGDDEDDEQDDAPAEPPANQEHRPTFGAEHDDEDQPISSPKAKAARKTQLVPQTAANKKGAAAAKGKKSTATTSAATDDRSSDNVQAKAVDSLHGIDMAATITLERHQVLSSKAVQRQKVPQPRTHMKLKVLVRSWSQMLTIRQQLQLAPVMPIHHSAISTTRPKRRPKR